MTSIEFLSPYLERVLPPSLPLQNFLNADKENPKKAHERMEKLGYQQKEQCYVRQVHGYDLADMVFNSSLPVYALDTEKQEWLPSKSKRLCPKGGSTFLIVSPHAYWARYRNGSLLGNHVHANKLFDYKDPKQGALHQFIQQWDGQAFMVFSLDNTPFDFKKVQMTYDLRHTVINHPMQAIVRDFSHLQETL